MSINQEVMHPMSAGASTIVSPQKQGPTAEAGVNEAALSVNSTSLQGLHTSDTQQSPRE